MLILIYKCLKRSVKEGKRSVDTWNFQIDTRISSLQFSNQPVRRNQYGSNILWHSSTSGCVLDCKSAHCQSIPENGERKVTENMTSFKNVSNNEGRL